MPVTNAILMNKGEMYMNRLFYHCLIVLLFTLSCSSDPKPDKSELIQILERHLPVGIEASKFSIEDEQNVGSKVEPIYQTRFKALLALKIDTYLNEGKDGSGSVNKPFKKQGHTIEIWGKSESRLDAENWKTVFTIDDSSRQRLQRLGKFKRIPPASRPVIFGNNEEAADYIADRERIEAEYKAALSAKMAKTLPGKWQWQKDRTIMVYKKDGTVEGTDKKGEKHKGNWHVNDGKLSIVENENTREFNVIQYSHNTLKVERHGTINIYNRVQ